MRGGVRRYVSYGDIAANGIGPASAAQGMAALHDFMQGLPGGHGPIGEAAAVAVRVSLALGGDGTVNGIQCGGINCSDCADNLAQTFAGERPCP